jgi:erythromycin esterase-like protein
MPDATPTYATLDAWIAAEAIPFALDDPASFNAAVDAVVASLGDAVALLGFGEALHGGEALLRFRNRLFQRLVEAHGYRAIAIESSFPRSRLVDDFVAGRGPTSYDEVRDAGFSHDFGRLEVNRELVEWMRDYNADPSHAVMIAFSGFDSPTEATGTDSPRQLLAFALAYLAAIDPALAQAHRERIELLLGQDAAWENPAVMLDPTQAIGLSPAATTLRIETEELISEMHARRPELVAQSGWSRYAEAVHHASAARQMLNYHAELARSSDDRVSNLLGLRDAMMADNLASIVARERGCGKVFAFAHNAHLQRGETTLRYGNDVFAWQPAGAHLAAMFGSGYAAIGSAVGVSAANGIGQPEPGALESLLTAAPGPARLIPTHRGAGLPATDLAALPTRSASARNGSYFPLTPRSLADFNWLAVFDETSYARRATPLP